MITVSSRLRLLFSFLSTIAVLALIPIALYAQAPTPAVGVRTVQPYLYYRLADGIATKRLAAGAFVVSYADPGGPLAKAGLQPGDAIIAFNNKRVCQDNDLTTAISSSGIGTEVVVAFVRGDELRTAKLRVANRLEFDSSFTTDSAAQVKIAADWERKDYKAVISDCRGIPESHQALVDTSCALAHYNRRDPRKGSRLFDLAQTVCPQCGELFADQAAALKTQQADYSGLWAKTVRLMDAFSVAQQRAFAAMDANVAGEMKTLAERGQRKAALERYTAFAQEEAGCRSLPPSQELVDVVGQLALQADPTLAVPESVVRTAKQARMAAQIAKNQPDMLKAEEKWISVTWLAPWWSEGYTNAADLLDSLGLPDDALALGKRALQLPRAKSTIAQAAPAAADEPIGNPEDALRDCVNKLATVEKGSADEQRLRLRAIRAALLTKPAPQVPMEAKRLVARGEAGIEMGQSKADFADAATEFEKGIQLAPWWADAYRGLGAANEKATNYRQAMVAYDFYVKAAPNAPDVADVQSKIFKLEYAADREQKQALEKVIAQKEASAHLQNLQGIWRERDKPAHVWQAAVQNGMFVASRPGATEDGVSRQGQFVLRAAFKGNGLDGTMAAPPSQIVESGCDVGESEQALSGTISEDGRTITVKYQQTVYTSQFVRATLFTNARCLKLEKLRDDVTVVVLEKQ